MKFVVGYRSTNDAMRFDEFIASRLEYFAPTGIVCFFNARGYIVRTYTMANVIKIEYPGLG